MRRVVIRESDRERLFRHLEQAMLAEAMKLKMEHPNEANRWTYGDLARGTIDRWLKDWRMVRR